MRWFGGWGAQIMIREHFITMDRDARFPLPLRFMLVRRRRAPALPGRHFIIMLYTGDISLHSRER